MHDYRRINSVFWTGVTGKNLRGDKDAQIVALYLVTCSHSSMIGVFHCPITYISHDTGLTSQGALKGLRRLSDEGFCTFDEARDLIWVHEMARFQIADSLSPNDNRVKSVGKAFSSLPMCLIKQGFYERYRAAFHLPELAAETRPLEGASDPLPSQKQEQEQDKDSLSERGSDERSKPRSSNTYPEPFEAFWRDYPRSPNMSKPRTLAEWKKLSADERKTCHDAVPAYRAFLTSKPDHPTMHAVTFIKERRFEGFSEQAASTAPRPLTDEDWLKRLGFGRNSRQWHVENWGPIPGNPDCRVPEHLLQPSDGQGWAVWEV